MANWILAANPKYYDHDKAFLDQGYVDWKQTRNFCVGDLVYVYCTKPIAKVKYKTVVSQTNMEPYVDKYWKIDVGQDRIGNRFMRLELVSICNSDALSFIKLKENGMAYPPQSPFKLKENLKNYIEEVFRQEMRYE